MWRSPKATSCCASSGAAGKVNISEDTHALVQNDFTCTARGKLAARHKGEIGMYFVEEDSITAPLPGL